MKKIALLLFLIYTISSAAQNTYKSPLDIPLILSANFGELRPNHFHSGIDLKTQGVVNKSVYSIEDGYISRISVSPSGYGLAIYVTHPSGHTSVYGHLNGYAPKIAEYIKAKQYEKESYRIDISLEAGEIPVKRGELIAYSGNTGSSGGPHVHFEIRNTEDQLVLDPLVYYKEQISDDIPPQLKGIAVYPIGYDGVVNGDIKPFRTSISIDKKGIYNPIKDTIKAWGRIGVGVYTNDRMTGTNNIYGVYKVRLFLNDEKIFSSEIASVNFETSKMINSMIDFDYWYNRRIFYQKSFIEPGNKLPIYQAVNNGYVDVKEEKVYNFRYELEDLYGNQTDYAFSIKGTKQNIPQPDCVQQMRWNEDNYYSGELFSIVVPKESLYKDLCFNLNRTQSANYMSSSYKVNDSHVPLNSRCEITIKLVKDTLPNKAQYGIVRVNDGSDSWVGGTYQNGAMTAGIGELGNTYAVSFDNKAPDITPIQPVKWVTQKEVKIRLTDNKSGIASCRGTIDGEFALFENDLKSPVYTYKFDSKRLKKGQIHQLVFTATDGCGNTSTYEYEFKY
ncbi:MAG: M23 family metallopeptidase [Dysgonomonas sp.]